MGDGGGPWREATGGAPIFIRITALNRSLNNLSQPL